MVQGKRGINIQDSRKTLESTYRPGSEQFDGLERALEWKMTYDFSLFHVQRIIQSPVLSCEKTLF